MECRVRDIPVYYETRGEGRPLLMLHGMPLDHRHMVRDFEPLFENRSGWRRVYLDLPGMGRTPGADWITRQDHMLEVVLEFVDKVMPGERFAVAGTSYGGHLARGVVYRRASMMDGLALLVPSIIAEWEKSRLPAHATLVEDPTLLEQAQPHEAEMLKRAVVQSQKLLDAERTVYRPASDMADRPFIKRLDETFSFDVDALPEPFPKPALFIMGRQDAFTGYRDAWDILENYPRATFAVLDRAGHPLPIDQEELFRALVNEWLDRVEENTGS